MILAIDPGSTESAYVVLNKVLKPIRFDKIPNNDLLQYLYDDNFADDGIEKVAIEMVACYGMPVGKEVFDTCVFIGELKEAIANTICADVQFIYRKDEKMNLCNSMKAKDSNIRQALIDRFAQFDLKNGKGTKKQKDWFYGFKADEWAAYAVGITYFDMYLKNKI